jgi:arylsulfatase A-like enzyme
MLVCLAATTLTCSPAPVRRTIHARIIDLVYGARAVVPLGTAHLPRDAIAGDTRPVLVTATTTGSAAVFEHARVTLDIPADAQLQLAYGARGRGRGALPAGATIEFRIAVTTAAGTQSVLDDVVTSTGDGPVAWKEATLPLPAAAGATLVFTTTVPTAVVGSILPQFAAPIVTVPTRTPRPRSIILISLDTLRANHLGIYGYPRATSPMIDRLFSSDGLVVDRTYSQAANTPGGHVAMLKSVWPTTAFKPDANQRLWQDEGVVSLAEVLRAQRYRTAAFTEDALLDGPAGFNRGFDDAYYEEMQMQGGAKGHIEKTFDLGLEWLGRHREEPVFLFLHTYQVHHPYTPPAEYAARFPVADDAAAPERDRSLYDGEIAYSDAQVARLLGAIDALGRRDETIVVVTADHGEEFAEHGRRLHGSNVTDEILHVPMLIRAPGLLPTGVRRDGPMALMDLPPTLLALLGYDAAASMHGRSLVAHLRDGTPVVPQPIFSEAAGALAENYGGLDIWYPPSYAVTLWPWRMARIRTDAAKGVRYTLYDLATDPGETRNRFGESDPDVEALRNAVDLYELTAQSEQIAIDGRMLRAANGGGTVPQQDPAREEKMRALGYIH